MEKKFLIIREISKKINFFLKKKINKSSSFKSRTFYAETFTLNSLYRSNLLNNKTKLIIYNCYKKKNKKCHNFHWEFNNYALLDYFVLSNDDKFNIFLKKIKFKFTKVTNWQLLRINSQILHSPKLKQKYIYDAKKIIRKNQNRFGLISDSKEVKSLQYHCFSASMIGEIYLSTGDFFFKEKFLKAVDFIRKFICKNGEALYLGRGQNQIFGYGSLIYILSLASKFDNKNKNNLLYDLHVVLNFIKKFQNKNGSFPLCLNGCEKDIPYIPNLYDPQYCGWYKYNNYYDYLAFFSFFLEKSYQIIGKKSFVIREKVKKDYYDKQFRIVRNKNYEAIISLPGGYLTNDLPLPYIIYKGKSLTPYYGGEQFCKSIVNEIKNYPYPFFYNINKSLRWRSKSFFLNKNLFLMVSPMGLMFRSFEFKKKIYFD